MAQGNFFSQNTMLKSKGPHLNMIQRTLKNWPGKNSKAFFLTEIEVQSFEKVKLLRCLTSPEAIQWIGINSSLGVNVIVTCQDLGQDMYQILHIY